MSDFEKRLAKLDEQLAAAKTDEEKAAALDKIVDEFDKEMQAQGLSEEERSEKIADIMTEIVNMMDEAGGLDSEEGDGSPIVH